LGALGSAFSLRFESRTEGLMGFLTLDLESDYFLVPVLGAEFLLLLYIVCNLNLELMPFPV
jgi:hypothetical protein